MSYKIIDEDLRIRSCSIDDLDQETKDLFVKQFNGDRIETLTFFYDQRNDILILNHDSKDYDLFELTVTTYLEAKEETRKYIKESAKELVSGNGYEESFSLLDNIVMKRERLNENKKAKEIKYILDQQCMEVFTENRDNLKALERIEEPGDYMHTYNAFMYGYIQGIRSERARRKRGQA